MSHPSPFDHRPDPELGRALRAALSAPDDAAFVARVMAASVSAPAREAGSWWEVLTAWARPGLAAAGLTVLLGVWLALSGNGDSGSALLEDPLRAAGERTAVPTFVVSAGVPEIASLLTLDLTDR